MLIKVQNKRKSRLLGFRRDERGTQLAELAIALPILLALFGATAEFGRFFYTYTTLAKATRSAARFLTTSTINAAEDERAKKLLVHGDTDGLGDPLVEGLETSNVEITRAGGVGPLPQTVTVKIKDWRYKPIFGLGKIVGDHTVSLDVDVEPSTTMRYLRTQPPTS